MAPTVWDSGLSHQGSVVLWGYVGSTVLYIQNAEDSAVLAYISLSLPHTKNWHQTQITQFYKYALQTDVAQQNSNN